MKFEEVKQLMSEAHDKDPYLPHPCCAFAYAVPYGIIETQEQYDYVKYYSDHTEISMEGMKTFEEDRGRYLNLGSCSAGAAFYFCTESVEYVLECIRKYIDIFPESPESVEWSYGKYGKIEF